MAAARDAVSGHGSLVLVTGEPGIGKTRLMSELARTTSELGLRAVTGRCWEEGGAPPYWPWVQVVRSIGGDLERLVDASDAQSGLQAATRAVAPESERLRLFDAVGRLLSSAASDAPLLVTLDDVHAADEPSLLLLRFLGEALSESRIVVVASYREAERRVRARADVFAELARVARRIPLRGLTPDEIAAYVESATGSQQGPQVASRLREITGGNPFFVDQVVRLLVAEGTLGTLDETTKDPLVRIPEEVRTLIRRRVAGLSSEGVTVLRVAAVMGREFDLHLLQQTSRLSPPRLLEVLDEATAVGVVAELPVTQRRYAFTHELMRETLYDDLPPARKLQLHQTVGRLLEDVYAEDLDPHLSEIARHLYLAAPLGNAEQALGYLVRAGDRAAALLAYEEAAVHYRRALELLALGEDGSGTRRGRLLLRLGDAQWRAGDGAEARVTFEEAIADGRRQADGELLGQAALGFVTALGGFLLYARFEVGASGVGLLEEALAALPPEDSSLRARLLAHLALEMWSANEPVERRVAVSVDALEMARRLDDSEALVTALHARHWALTTPGMAHDRLEHAEEMLRVARHTVSPELEFLAHNARFHSFLELCDRRGMDAESQAMSELSERLRQPFYAWHTVCLRALRATLDGRFVEAERLAGDALRLSGLRQSEYAAYVHRYAQMLAIRWAQGRVEDVWPGISDHAERYPWIPRWRDPLAACETGDSEAARHELERQGGLDFADLPRDGLWLLHLCTLADAAAFVRDEPRAALLYELLLPHADDNAVSYTQQPFGPVALRLGKLAAILGRWKDADRHFSTALARCELLGARAIRARVLIEYARALVLRGEEADRSRLEAMLDEAGQLSEELGATGLLERVALVRLEHSAERPRDKASFSREGDVWRIAWKGQSLHVRDVKGLGYMAALLREPGREVHVLELVRSDAGSAAHETPRRIDADLALSAREPVDPLLDDRAKAEYARRLEELDDELDEARTWGDLERAARLEEESELIRHELARALGLAGRDRTFATSSERARVSVTKAIRTAIRLLSEQSPDLARHLDTSIRTGQFCSYAPPGEEPPQWTL